MKKVLAIMIASILCLGLVACGGGTDTPTTTPAATETATGTPVSDVDKLEAIKTAGKIVMVTSPDFAPYEFEDPSKSGQDRYVGMDIELGKYIAQELGVELEIKPMDFDATLVAVGQNQCDIGISGYSPSEERKATMDFSDVYYEGDQVVVIRKADADTYKKAEDLVGKKVGAQNASEQQAIVEDQLEGSELQKFTKVPEAVVALKTNVVEAVALEGPNAEQIVKQNDDLMVSEIKVEGSTTGTAIAVPKGNNAAFLTELNRIIQKAKDEGKFNEWLSAAQELQAEMTE